MTEMFGAKSEEEFLTSPFYAPVRQAMMAKKDVIERLAAKKQVGGPMPEDEGNPDTVNSAADNADADAVDAYASLGGLSAMDLTDPKQISQAILANAKKQQDYYDDLANQIKQRRYGPSETEKLLALSSAFFQPTSVRGFSGTMGNVLPVLQKFGELRRTGEEKRAEALQGLVKQRAALEQGDLKTAIELQRLMRTYPTGLTYDTQRGIFVDKNNPRPTQTVYAVPGTNRELVQWQDGLWRESMPDGSMKVFERSGDNFKELRVERAS